MNRRGLRGDFYRDGLRFIVAFIDRIQGYLIITASGKPFYRHFVGVMRRLRLAHYAGAFIDRIFGHYILQVFILRQRIGDGSPSGEIDDRGIRHHAGLHSIRAQGFTDVIGVRTGA
ncbi:hypothetical protein D3C87_1753260 [compost metagenome]